MYLIRYTEYDQYKYKLKKRTGKNGTSLKERERMERSERERMRCPILLFPSNAPRLVLFCIETVTKAGHWLLKYN